MDERRELVELLLENARYSTDDLARQLDADPDAVESMLAELEDDGILLGYQAVIDWDRLGADHAQAEVELNVELDRETSYDDIAGRISKFSEVESLRLVSGEYDFAVDVEAASMHDISRFVSERIAPIPEVTQTVTHFVMATYKERGIELNGDGDDERLSVSP